MEEVLQSLGLSEKEAKFYLLLLNENGLTAAVVAKKLKESRTNSYMVLDKLIAERLVEADDSAPIRTYRAADPIALKRRVSEQAQLLKQNQSALEAVLPDLTSLYNLSQHRPGVVYLEGLKGIKALLEDCARITEGTIDVIASDEAKDDQEVWELLQKGGAKRSARGIKTRGLFHVSNDAHWTQIKKWETKGYEVRRWGKESLPGEIVTYGDKVAFTTYSPALVVTIVTDTVISQTHRIIFEQLWEQAESNHKRLP